LGGWVKNLNKILQQICENLKGGAKNFKKLPFFGGVWRGGEQWEI